MTATPNRNVLFTNEIFSAPKTMVSHATELDGGTLKIKQTGLIDGKLTDLVLVSSDDTPIKISALAVLENCKIECNDLLIEGSFTGEIKAKGNVEFGDSALVQGILHVGGTLLVNKLADAVDMKIVHFSPKKSEQAVESKASGHQVYQLKPSDAVDIARAG